MPRTYRLKNKNLPAKYVGGYLSKMDGREELTKRLIYAYESVTSDCGGAANMPYAKRALAERFSWLEEFLRQMEAELVKGAVERSDLLGKWVQGVNALTGLSKSLGISDPNKSKDWIDVDLYGDDVPTNATETPTSPPGATNSRGGSKPRTQRVRLNVETVGDTPNEEEKR